MATKLKLTTTTMPNVLQSLDELKSLVGETLHAVHGFISPKLARGLILAQPPSYQRRLDRSSIGLYRRQMAAKPTKWRHHQADNLLVFDKAFQMMEGQHRCIASVEADATFGAWIIGHQNPEEVKYLGQMRARSVSQTMEMFGQRSATKIAGVAKMFLFWTLNESPLATGRISPVEADEILGAYPEIHEWYLLAMRIKRSMITTPSGPWLAYILGQMFICDEAKAQVFAEVLENHSGDDMPGVLIRTWSSRRPSNAIAAKVWYHNTAARAWEAFIKNELRSKLVGPKDRLLEWATTARKSPA